MAMVPHQAALYPAAPSTVSISRRSTSVAASSTSARSRVERGHRVFYAHCGPDCSLSRASAPHVHGRGHRLEGEEIPALMQFGGFSAKIGIPISAAEASTCSQGELDVIYRTLSRTDGMDVVRATPGMLAAIGNGLVTQR